MDEDYVIVDNVDEHIDEEIIILSNADNIDIISKINNINIHNEHYYMFDIKNYIDDIYESYKSTTKIENQFCVDFPREDVYINNYKVNSINEFVSMLNEIKTYNYHGYDIKILLIMLCCQSSFYLTFVLVSNMYNSPKDHRFVVSRKQYEKEYNTKIYIKQYKNDINICLKTYLNVIDVRHADIINIISTEISFDIKKHIKFCKDYGIVSWIKTST